MSTITSPVPQPGVASPVVVPVCRADVEVESKITIPGWINSLQDYRDWAESDDYPTSGWVSYLDGTIWVDANMEEFFSHNQIKQAFNGGFHALLTQNPVGRWVPDRMFFASEPANLATEPDGMFYLWATMETGRLRPVPGKMSGYMQLEGTPDIVLEIVSDSSVTKDLKKLRELYWKADIPEYWLVDVRGEAIRFDILRHTKDGYIPSTSEAGWVRSDLLVHSFQIERTVDPLGYPQFVVHAKA